VILCIIFVVKRKESSVHFAPKSDQKNVQQRFSRIRVAPKK
jgi:hypothetical protein